MHVIGTAGHVDHGKSTLVHRLTGIDPDRFEEEKRRGLTIDLGFAWLALPSGREIGLIDVPGHERFIRNMLAGAGGISVCLFVVAANEGWMPQSAEHLAVLHLLGISSGVVALTKIDAVGRDVVEKVAAEVHERLSVSTLAGSPVVGCSAVTGVGVGELLDEIDRVLADAPAAADNQKPRLWVDRVFTISGAGTVLTGTLTGGALATGEEVEVAPEGRRARIRAIQTHKKEVASIAPGNRVALNLVGLERQGAERGDAVMRPGQYRSTRRVDVRLQVLPESFGHLPPGHEVSDKGSFLLHVGSAETPVTLKLLDRNRLVAGDFGYAQLFLRDPLPLQRGDRFVLRDAGRVLTFGGGEVLDPLAPPARRNDIARVDLLRRLADAGATEAMTALVEAEGVVSLKEALLRSGADLPAPHVTILGDFAFSRQALQRLHDDVRANLQAFHSNHPMEQGISREALRADLGLDAGVFNKLVEGMHDVVAEGALVRSTSHEVAFAPEQAAARDALLDRIRAAGYTPPLAKELDGDTPLVRALAQAGDLVKIGDFFLTRQQANEARARVRSAIRETGPLTVAQIRDLLGTSRKYAVPLCEWLDATGATVRRGDVRLLGPKD